MKLFRASWFVGRWCCGFAGDLLRWIVWITLGALLAAQIYVASSRQLTMPGWMLRQLESRFARAGLRIHFDRAVIDPSGRVVVDQLQIFSTSFDTPLLTAGRFYAHFNPWALVRRELEPTEIRAGGLTFWVPAMLSPSGRSEPAARDVSATVKFAPHQLTIEQLTGQIANLSISLHGAVDLPKEFEIESLDLTSVGGGGSMRVVMREYLRGARALVELQPELAKFEDPSLELELAPDASRMAMVNARFSSREAAEELTRFGAETGRLLVTDLRAFTRFPLVSEDVQPVYIGAHFAHATAADAEAHDVQLSLKADLGALYGSFVPRELLAGCDSLTVAGESADKLWVRVLPQSLPLLQVEAHTRAAGSIWSVQGEAETKAHRASFLAEGHVTNELIQLVSARIGHDLSIVKLSGPAPVRAHVDFGDGWKFTGAHGDLSSGALIAAPVPFDGLSADFDYDGRQLQITNLLGRQGRNYARGAYLMDAKTYEFAFLLRGRLSPVDISGWFRDWWSGFWHNFDFSAMPPDADAQVTGRWGFPHLTTVFAHADVQGAAVRSVAFDRLRTTMFIRPEFYDATEFFATLGGGTARGTFTRSVDLLQGGIFRWMDFDVTSDIDLAESARVFGAAGQEIVEPFTFAQPPTLRLKGRIDGPAAPGGKREAIDITLDSKGAFSFHKFPLGDLSFHAALRDDNLDLDRIAVAFAGGQVHARAFLRGRDTARRLSFDGTLTGAKFGEAIRVMEKFSAERRGQPTPRSKYQEQTVPGLLKLQAAAEGLYHDPFSFRGRGNVEITGAQLGEINLLGGLSKLLRDSSVFNFTSLQLTTAQSSFTLDQTNLTLPDLQIRGPSADLEAKGLYQVDRKEMDFNAKLYPFEHGKTLLANAVSLMLVPVSNVLEFKLTGTLADPHWRFAYGPTSLLHSLKNKKTEAPAADTPAVGRKQPPPMLRR